MPFKNLVIENCDAEGGTRKSRAGEWDPASHLLGIDMKGHTACHKPCYEYRILLKVGTFLRDIASVQGLDDDWQWEQEE